MSDKQNAFIARLVGERYVSLGAPSAAEALASIPLAQMDTRQKSQVIDRLLALPKDPVPGMPEVVASFRNGTNDSPGACYACGHTVEAGTGFYFGPHATGKRWQVHHKVGECSTEPVAPPVEIEAGHYLVGEGADATLIQVYVTRNDRLGGKVWEDGKFRYQKGAVHLAGTGERITEEEMAAVICLKEYGALPGSAELQALAARHGIDHGNCIFCHKDLTDPRSDPVQGGAGYGPTCARKYSLPWG